jgi:EmrB/QacA subfamily drug resistance transporter
MISDMSSGSTTVPSGAVKGSALVLGVLAAGQFLMTLDSSVMNVSMPTVASDLGTSITGIQTAITMYTLVMAALMITGGKIGTILGRRKTFGIGLVIYGLGSFTTAIAPNLGVLLFGWSLLEGIGAALIMPAIVALVAANVPVEGRTRAYGLVAAAGAVAVAVGPLIGGAVTTYASWRYVFLGEVVIVVAILFVLRKIADVPPQPASIDVPGAVLSALGLALVVFGVLKSSSWGWVRPTATGPELFGVSLTVWFILAGVGVLYVLTLWERRVEARGGEPLIRLDMFANRQLTGGLTMFFSQFMVQAGVFFVLPLFLSVVLGLSAVETGVKLLPLSAALLLTALGIPRVRPNANPRRVVRVGLLAMLLGILPLIAGMKPDASAAVVFVPLVLLGLGLGALSSQLGAVTVSAVPDEQSAEVGGLQNTATNLGASLGTALIGAVLIATLSTTVLSGITSSPEISDSVKAQATTQLVSGAPFISDTQLETALTDAGVSESESAEIVAVNADARLDALRAAFALAALLALIALFFTGRIPDIAPGTKRPE